MPELDTDVISAAEAQTRILNLPTDTNTALAGKSDASRVTALEKAVQNPVAIAASRDIAESDLGKLLVVDGSSQVDITLVTGLTTGGGFYIKATDLSAGVDLLEGAGINLSGTASLRKTDTIYFVYETEIANTWAILGNEALDISDLPTEVLLTNATKTLTKGIKSTSVDGGTVATGTFTPVIDDSNYQHIVNGGAFTLAAPAGVGGFVLEVENNASAGAISTSGFDAVTGDAFTTTDGDKFQCTVQNSNSLKILNVVHVAA